MKDHLPEQRPEGKALQAALKTDGRSVRQVAPLAGLTEARWRQIVKGSMTANGRSVEVIAPAATLARMAQVLDVAPAVLSDAGREDAAEILEHRFEDVRRAVTPPPGISGAADSGVAEEVRLIEASSLSALQKLELLRTVLRLRAEAEREAAAIRRDPCAAVQKDSVMEHES